MERENFSIKKGWAKKIVKSVEHAVEHTVKEIEKVVVAVAKEAVKILKTIGEDIAFAPLLIFKPVMKKEIANRGLTDDGTLLDITGKFLKALMTEGQASHFDGFHFDLSKPNFGLPVAPVLVKTPIHLAATAVGVPLSAPGLPDPADVVWGFFHKEANKPGSHTATVVQAHIEALKADNSVKAKFSEFLHDPKKLAITIAIISVIIAAIFLIPSKK